MILELLERMLAWRNSGKSGEDAKRRLKFIIAHDRADISEDVLELMRRDIVEVVSRYVDIDPEEMEFSLESDQRMTALIANLPIRRIKRRSNLTTPQAPSP
jgi:cell division topological specificity factor